MSNSAQQRAREQQMSGAQKATMNIQEVLANNQVYADVLSEELTGAQQANIGLKVSLRLTKTKVDALEKQVIAQSETSHELTQTVDALKESLNLLQEKFNGAIWYIGNMSRQDVTPEFVKEVHETYLAHQEQIKRKANQREVDAVHAKDDLDKRAELEDKADAINIVASHQEGRLEANVETKPTEEDQEVASVTADMIEEEKKLFSEAGSAPEIEVVEDKPSSQPHQVKRRKVRSNNQASN